MLITSLDNKKIKKYSSLKNAKNRHLEGMFLVEGMHLVEEAHKAHQLIDILLLEGDELSFETDLEITYVTSEILKKVSSLTTFNNVIGVCKISEQKELLGSKLLLLDDIQDPGNLGTIIRSACAFNVDTIILSPNTVDLYNEKVIRSTQGMLFHMNIICAELQEVITNLKKAGYQILGTNVKNGVNVKKMKIDKFALVMGNEGHGVSQDILDLCDANLYISMNPRCESLNVGVATSILLYELSLKEEL